MQSGALCAGARFVSCFDLGKGMDLGEHTHGGHPSRRAKDCTAPSSVAAQQWQSHLTLRGCRIRDVCAVHASPVADAASSFTQHSLILTRVKWLHRRYYSYGRGGRVCAFTINPGARGVSGRSQTNNHPRLPRNRHSQVEKRRAPCCQGQSALYFQLRAEFFSLFF